MTCSVIYFGLSLVLLMVITSEGSGIGRLFSRSKSNLDNDTSSSQHGVTTPEKPSLGSGLKRILTRSKTNLDKDASSSHGVTTPEKSGIGSGLKRILNRSKTNLDNDTGGYNNEAPFSSGRSPAPLSRGGHSEDPSSRGGHDQAPSSRGGYGEDLFSSTEVVSEEEKAVRIKKMEKIAHEIRTELTPLSDDAINLFILFANARQNTSGDMKRYELLDISMTMTPEDCEKHAKINEDDVQILYVGNIERSIRHYICVHYVHAHKIVYVHDSLGLKLNDNQKKVVKALYPESELEYDTPMTTLTGDARSCGLFAIAYATTIICGECPEYYGLRLSTERDPSMTLRTHLDNMFHDKILSLFPPVMKEDQED